MSSAGKRAIGLRMSTRCEDRLGFFVVTESWVREPSGVTGSDQGENTSGFFILSSLPRVPCVRLNSLL